MKLLVDTQCWLWWFSDVGRLNEEAVARIADEANELWLSAASVWEIAIKVSVGKLSMPEAVDEYVARRMRMLNMRSLDIRASHALRAASLPLHHKDPFDRMLIAQGQLEGMTIVTADSVFGEYAGTAVLWAAGK